ncbi:Uncharacterised protein [Mycobacterium tuberculosis]|uniref:Uncharacterized protein n=1 Tax=Mycobacterium tuberculosis TaxID=1773 RepID=A0A655D217_MYCTX|nr:Uncharacterised protein [Mycobacterium tuberculosis]CKS45903.1 Uncharacterised protein [Mycobacterium tuberculosis]CNU40079.1 Uncharacterised protein [Mycobacterium tuberculosis]COW46666.1 Uncharacterised protein [Mycobacterium tuberculosis]COW74680.1 Uncharacterised protein [Mycobacterium tuberculosis]
MPPLNSRSTGARRIARIRLGGAISAAPPSTEPSMPRTARTCALSGMAFCSRLYTPPPSLIRDLS